MSLTKYSTKHTCPSSFSIIYCNERNPLASILIDTLLDGNKALVDGFSKDVLYLKPHLSLKFSENTLQVINILKSQWLLNDLFSVSNASKE